jgi:hypothetical protein
MIISRLFLVFGSIATSTSFQSTGTFDSEKIESLTVNIRSANVNYFDGKIQNVRVFGTYASRTNKNCENWSRHPDVKFCFGGVSGLATELGGSVTPSQIGKGVVSGKVSLVQFPELGKRLTSRSQFVYDDEFFEVSTLLTSNVDCLTGGRLTILPSDTAGVFCFKNSKYFIRSLTGKLDRFPFDEAAARWIAISALPIVDLD